MSMKNTKNLFIIAAVVVALTAGTVLLGNYTNILSTGSETDSQPKACQAAKNAACTASQALFAENAEGVCAQKTEGDCAQKAECGSAEKTCPLDSTKPCCAQEGSKECPKSGDAADCPKSGDATGCPKSEATAAAKTGCCPGTVTEQISVSTMRKRVIRKM